MTGLDVHGARRRDRSAVVEAVAALLDDISERRHADLRNHTKQVVERIEDGTTMYLTKNGERIATITPSHPKTWANHVDDVLGGDDYDSGLRDLLADDDARSADFDDEHLGQGP